MSLNSTVLIQKMQNLSSFSSTMDYAASSTDGVFFQMLSLAIFIVLFTSFRGYGLGQSLLISGFMCAILNALLLLGGWSSLWAVIIFLVLMAIGAWLTYSDTS